MIGNWDEMTASERHQAAGWIRHRLEQRGWQFSVNERGLLDLIIGDEDLPNCSQDVTLHLIRLFKAEITAALREEARGVEH